MNGRSPRVLQVVLSLNAGGTERLVVELARRLRDDVPMAVCCLDEEGTWASELTAAGIRVEALHRQPGFVPQLGRAVADSARRHRATVVHCHHYSPFVYGVLAKLWRPGLQVIYTEHGRLSDTLPSRKRRFANSIFGRVPGAVFAVSDELRAHLVEEGFSPQLARVIYNGIDPGPVPGAAERAKSRGRLGVPEHTLVVGSIARLDPVKDLGTLVKAVQLIRDIPVLLLVIGDGPERQSLRLQAEGAGVADHVCFLGHRDDARRWLAGCDVYVNSSVSEGVSLTILEAMAAGLPIIATHVGGTPEVVDAATGYLVPSRDPAAIATALRALHERPDVRQDMGRAARRRVELDFTLDRMIEQYRDVYRKLA